MKAFLGVLLKDVPRYLAALMRNDSRYLALCNRAERLEVAPDLSGYRCDWQWTSDLYAPKVLPALGRRLMTKALSAHPIRRLPEPETVSEQPEVSFVIGHRGMARLPHMLATLESIAGQQGVAFECLVVEQETNSQLAGKLPAWVRHIHTPPPSEDMPYSRSWAFNVGVMHARGNIIVLHDNDICISSDYSKHIYGKAVQGFEVINLKRFIFFLSERHTTDFLDERIALTAFAPESIMQNAEGGGSIAITRDAYQRIGGMDESFIGWGGEDNEFWERAQTCNVWPYGYLPLVHLWHPSQPGKHDPTNRTLSHYQSLASRPVIDRIARLWALPAGSMSGPVGYDKSSRL